MVVMYSTVRYPRAFRFTANHHSRIYVISNQFSSFGNHKI